MAAPALPEPPREYNRDYMRSLLGTLRTYFTGQLDQKDPVLRALSVMQTVTTTTLSLGVQDGGVLLVDTTSNNVAVTLPAASDSIEYQFIVKRVSGGANTLTITATSGNIDGAASASIAVQYTSLTFRSDGTNYWVV